MANLENGATLEMVENIINGNTPVAKATSAENATALTTNAGSSTKPVYFSGGKPVQCNSTLGVNISGSAASASYASSAGTASRATSDGDGNNIAATYATKAEVSGGGGSSGQFYVHNISYSASYRTGSGVGYATLVTNSATPFTASSLETYMQQIGDSKKIPSTGLLIGSSGAYYMFYIEYRSARVGQEEPAGVWAIGRSPAYGSLDLAFLDSLITEITDDAVVTVTLA